MHALMVRYAEGDDLALPPILGFYEGRVRRQIAKQIYDPSIRDDLFQRFALRVHTSRAKYPDSASAAAMAVDQWLLLIARRVVLDHLRAEYRRSARRAGVERTLGYDGFGRKEPDRSPEESLCRFEEREHVRTRVRHALDALSPMSAEIVRRHKLEGRPMSSLAADLGVSVGAVRVRAHRAYRQLARVLAPA